MTPTRFARKYLNINTCTTDKDAIINHNIDWFLNKTARMFEYENLPPSLPAIALERILQLCGSACIWRVPSAYIPVGHGPSFNSSDLLPVRGDDSSNLYAFPYTLADAPDPYGEPYKVVITSPGFRPTISETLTLNSECVIIRNDTNYRGLYQLHRRYAELLAEAELSLRSTLLVLRDQLVLVAKTESQRRAVQAYLDARSVGNPAFIFTHDMGTPLEALGNTTHDNSVELAVNGIQAIKAAWYNEIGLNPSFSMKREYTSAQEIDTNTDLLLPIVDDMFESRRVGLENVNALFGTNISVRRSSAWRVKEHSIELIQEQEEADIALTEAQAEAADLLPVRGDELQKEGDDNGDIQSDTDSNEPS